MILILDNIRSVYNVGSLFRTADAVGVERIVCIGITPLPVDRFNRVRQSFKKVSLGAEDTIPYTHATINDALSLVSNHTLIALEQTDTSIPYTSLHNALKNPSPIALVVGNECEGVSKEFQEAATASIEIPMSGTKESLNVSVAGAIILFYIRDIKMYASGR